jgi:hypothetical protein
MKILLFFALFLMSQGNSVTCYINEFIRLNKAQSIVRYLIQIEGDGSQSVTKKIVVE